MSHILLYRKYSHYSIIAKAKFLTIFHKRIFAIIEYEILHINCLILTIKKALSLIILKVLAFKKAWCLII